MFPPDSSNPFSRSPGVLGLSVIIPARNESENIASTIAAALAGSPTEVIVVDGHSSDSTARIARLAGAVVIDSAPCRGIQLKTGALAAQGEILLFLHADTTLPPGYTNLVADILACPGVAGGAFHLRIDAPHARFRAIEALVNARSRFLGMPFGDQAIFCLQETYRLSGGFPPWPAMEDIAFVRALRRLGQVALAPARVRTSARRWLKHGVLRTTLLNQISIAAFRLGVPPERIAIWRNSIGGLLSPAPEAETAINPTPWKARAQ